MDIFRLGKCFFIAQNKMEAIGKRKQDRPMPDGKEKVYVGYKKCNNY